ncbi:MAG TPA: Lrp/AsnC family transcriptional regulator [Rhodospirillales bacterium]|jgi:DNA-binding Lrp family transcriptional regulator|nr:Lrp/AsnC family transcriptional regulator [Rhodospirillales bacterium]
MDPTAIEYRLLNDYQRDFPLEPRPYARIAADLGIDEDEVLACLAGLREAGAVSRVGAVIRPGTVGASTLAAIRVPDHRLEEVAAQVNAFPEVNHNYERDHAINLWFVITAPDGDRLAQVLREIENKVELQVIDLPLVTAFHIDLGFELKCR